MAGDWSQTVATLAVGTEITDGQISDRNSQWLSARMAEFGYFVAEHRAVPDDRAKILRSLNELAKQARIVFVTGGLGPTSDDFTRESVAQFVAKPLIWHQASWEQILERLALRGAQVTENQKQQCFFPDGATVLRNSNGTANGFLVATDQGGVVVSLPGPPAEIRAIWQDGLSRILEPTDSNGLKKSRELTLLKTMGIGEGALASGVEEIAIRVADELGLPKPFIGYRAHAPYVEVKLWATDEIERELVTRVATELRRRYAEFYIGDGRFDLADRVLEKIERVARAGGRVLLVDGCVRGELVERFYSRAMETKNEAWKNALDTALRVTLLPREEFDALYEADCGDFQGAPSLILLLGAGVGDLALRLAAVTAQERRARAFELPRLAVTTQSERGRKWAIEAALRYWGE
ncbi:MAG: competence/damage-inducible protein A [Bdellovibrionales bacterium]|nr:competence/damage-inducible protein A [Bdellovibrionales bacterium]